MNERYYTEQNKVALAHIDSYERSQNYTLSNCYASYSENKERAYNYCLNLMRKLNGFGLKIISYNCMFFTVGFLFTDPETGVIRFAYITKDYDRFSDYM